MPALSPSASRIAWPRTMRRCLRLCGARRCRCRPTPRTVRSVSECLANAVSMWSKNGTVVSMRLRPGAVEVEVKLDGRLARRAATAWRCGAVAHERRSYRREGVEEGRRLVLRARGDPQVVRDTPTSRMSTSRVVQRAPGRGRVVHAAEEHEVRPRRRAACSRGAATRRPRCGRAGPRSRRPSRASSAACRSAARRRAWVSALTGGTAGAPAASASMTAGSAAR